MASSTFWPSLAVALALLNLGCQQEAPRTSQSAPTPTTSAQPSSNATGSSTQTVTSSAQAQSAPASGIDSKTGGSAADALITGKVKAELLKATEGRSIEIDVETKNGVVRLTGFAPTNSDIDNALEIARQVDGVKGVQQKLAVKPS